MSQNPNSADGKPPYYDALADYYFANKPLYTLIESTNVGLWERSIINNEAWWSPKFCQLLGYNYGELDHSYQHFINYLVHPDDKDRVYKAFQSHVQHNTIYREEFRMRTKNQGYRWFESTGKAWPSEDGSLSRMIGAITDVDKKKRDELELQGSLDLLSDQNKRLQNFAHIVSHNLRSHSGNLQFMVSLFEEEPQGSERIVIFRNIKLISESLANTIEHLNEIVKIQTQISKELVTVNLQQTFDNILKTLDTNIAEAGATVKVNFEQCNELKYVAAYLDSIFLNLLTNALKYRRPGVPPIINCYTYMQNKHVILVFEDNGLGIDLKRYGNKVFGMYQTFHQHVNAKGLGLFITRSQIESLGGSIKIDSEVNVGTKFTIQLT